MKPLLVCSFVKKEIKKLLLSHIHEENNNEFATFVNSWKTIMKLQLSHILSIKRNSETRTFINLGQQKSSLVSGNRKNFYHSLARLVELLSECIFLISKKKQTRKKNQQEY